MTGVTGQVGISTQIRAVSVFDAIPIPLPLPLSASKIRVVSVFSPRVQKNEGRTPWELAEPRRLSTSLDT